jgi:hypothetical protein
MEMYELNSQNSIFMHDNDPKHTAKKTTEWLKVQRLEVLKWPANSPDLNPIENIWNILELRIRKRKIRFNSKDELWAIMQEEWYKIDTSFIKDLYLSMPARITDCIKGKGGIQDSEIKFLFLVTGFFNHRFFVI